MEKTGDKSMRHIYMHMLNTPSDPCENTTSHDTWHRAHPCTYRFNCVVKGGLRVVNSDTTMCRRGTKLPHEHEHDHETVAGDISTSMQFTMCCIIGLLSSSHVLYLCPKHMGGNAA